MKCPEINNHQKKDFYSTTHIFTIALLALLILILMPETCLEGARRGLILWYNTLLPTLFPFFLITRLIIELDLCPKVLRPYYPVFVGLLAGYPAGALTCSEMSKRGLLSRSKAQCLLIACNNASPAFLINYVNCCCLDLTGHRFIIWMSVISSSFIIAIFYYMLFCNTDNTEYTPTASPVSSTPDDVPVSSVVEAVMMHSFEILVMIGGYVIIFSILAAILMVFPVSGLCAAVLSGILEVTTGCGLIAGLTPDIPLYIKSAAAAALCGFGGLSAILQTNSAIRASKLSIKKYILHKSICGILSGIICVIILSVIHHHP